MRRRPLLIAVSLAMVAVAFLAPGTVPARVGPSADSRLVIAVVRAPAAEVTRAKPAAPAAKMVGAAPRVAAEAAPRADAPPAKPRFVAARDVDLGIRQVHADRFQDDAPPPQPSGPCAKASTCRSHAIRPARWKADQKGTSEIVWKFNDSGRRNLRAPAGLLESALAYSTREWSRWNSNIVFSHAGSTTAPYGGIGKDGSCDDGTNVITWDRFDPQVIAQAGVCMDKTGRIVRDADLALNVTYHWEDIRGEPESRHSFDIRSIVMHELGHWLGLVDLYSSDDVHQTMSGYSEYGETSKRTPALGDVLGIQELFPCGDGDTCPRRGVADD